MDKIYYFSGTGNSFYTAKKISEALGGELINIAEVIEEKETIFQGERIGIVFPLYATGIPHMVGKFLTNLEIEGEPYIYSICTCGSPGYGVAFQLIDSILKDKREGSKKKLALSYSSFVQMPDNYIKLFKIKEREKINELLEIADIRIEKKIEDIKEKKKNSYMKFLLNPLFKMLYMFWLGNLKKADKKFLVKNSCTSCNICSEICPSKNIQMKNGKPTWNGNCQDCLGCINLCPVSAIEYGKKTEKKGRYRNPVVNIEQLKVNRKQEVEDVKDN